MREKVNKATLLYANSLRNICNIGEVTGENFGNLINSYAEKLSIIMHKPKEKIEESLFSHHKKNHPPQKILKYLKINLKNTPLFDDSDSENDSSDSDSDSDVLSQSIKLTNFPSILFKKSLMSPEKNDKEHKLLAVPVKSVIASPVLFAGRGNPKFIRSGSPQLSASQPRDDRFPELAGTANKLPRSLSF